MQSLKIVTILRKEVNLSVPQVCSEYFSATDYRPDFLVSSKKLIRRIQSLKILRILRNEVVKTVSHKFNQSTSLLQSSDLIFLGDLEKLMRRMLSFKIATIKMK